MCLIFINFLISFLIKEFLSKYLSFKRTAHLHKGAYFIYFLLHLLIIHFNIKYPLSLNQQIMINDILLLIEFSLVLFSWWRFWNWNLYKNLNENVCITKIRYLNACKLKSAQHQTSSMFLIDALYVLMVKVSGEIFIVLFWFLRDEVW